MVGVNIKRKKERERIDYPIQMSQDNQTRLAGFQFSRGQIIIMSFGQVGEVFAQYNYSLEKSICVNLMDLRG
jgi:phosphotransferase system  glucose/maltose/N-acetylglucosamine-specific IIC component